MLNWQLYMSCVYSSLAAINKEYAKEEIVELLDKIAMAKEQEA